MNTQRPNMTEQELLSDLLDKVAEKAMETALSEEQVK